MGLDADFVTGLILRLPVVLFSLTLHEFMHAWAAWKCGDDTALRAGRVTFNPLAHLDPLGTLGLMVGPIGWAKPVPVDPTNFAYETRRRDEVLVSGAGVAANLAVGVALALVLRFFAGNLLDLEEVGLTLYRLVYVGSFVNIALAVFNLLPLHPLDGSHILENALPLNAALWFHARRAQGMTVLGILILGNLMLARVVGFSLLGYPVRLVMGLVSGLDLA